MSGEGGAQLALDQPILFKVGELGPGYQAWLRAPVPGRPRFFESPWLEALTQTPWWVVPALWGPLVCCLAAACLRAGSTEPPVTLALAAAGVVAWQGLEYAVHRCAFHAEARGYWGITLHFAFHGCHHKFPQDGGRLVFPPLFAGLGAAGIYSALRALLPGAAVLPVLTGVITGYLSYDCLHYALHHSRAPLPLLKGLRRAHLHHHFRDPDHTFGISSPLFDVLAGSGSPLLL